MDVVILIVKFNNAIMLDVLYDRHIVKLTVQHQRNVMFGLIGNLGIRLSPQNSIFTMRFNFKAAVKGKI